MVDAGNLFWKDARLPDAKRAEQEAKARLQADALALGGIDAALPGPGDWALGHAFVREMAGTLPYVVSNLACEDELPFPARREVTRDGLRVAFYGVVPPSLAVSGCRPSDPTKAVVLGDEDVSVVLSTQTGEEDGRLAAAVPGVDLVVNGRDRKMLQSPEVLPNGGLLLSAGSRGKTLGALSFTRVPGATGWRDAGAAAELATRRDRYSARVTDLEGRLAREEDAKLRARLERQRDVARRQLEEIDGKLAAVTAASAAGPVNEVRNALVELGADVPDHAATAAKVAAAKQAVAGLPAFDAAAYDGPFVGSAACTGCHPAQADQWKGTAHARAWGSLVAVTRQFDRDCFACHVTGAHHPDGPTEPRALAGLEDVGCESCHGPGRDHAAMPASVDMVRAPAAETCTACHDGKMDEGRFDAATYLPKVAH